MVFVEFGPGTLLGRQLTGAGFAAMGVLLTLTLMRTADSRAVIGAEAAAAAAP